LTRSNKTTDRRSLDVIAQRQCTKTLYDGRSLAPAEAAELESAGMGYGVRIKLIDDAALKETILEIVNEGNRSQLSDPAFRRELIAWIRVNDTQAIESGDELPVWIATGHAYERFALRATASGIRNAFINQSIEVRRLRRELHSVLGLGGTETAHLMVRYGRGPLAPYSLRRPVADVRIR
jgi:hypothetical protein